MEDSKSLLYDKLQHHIKTNPDLLERIQSRMNLIKETAIQNSRKRAQGLLSPSEDIKKHAAKPSVETLRWLRKMVNDTQEIIEYFNEDMVARIHEIPTKINNYRRYILGGEARPQGRDIAIYETLEEMQNDVYFLHNAVSQYFSETAASKAVEKGSVYKSFSEFAAPILNSDCEFMKSQVLAIDKLDNEVRQQMLDTKNYIQELSELFDNQYLPELYSAEKETSASLKDNKGAGRATA